MKPTKLFDPLWDSTSLLYGDVDLFFRPRDQLALDLHALTQERHLAIHWHNNWKTVPAATSLYCGLLRACEAGADGATAGNRQSGLAASAPAHTIPGNGRDRAGLGPCATLVVNRLRANEPFRPGAGPNNGDFFLPWRRLRERFAAAGVDLNTRDVNAGPRGRLRAAPQRAAQVAHPLQLRVPLRGPGRAADQRRPRGARALSKGLHEQRGADRRRAHPAARLSERARRARRPRLRARDLFCVMIASNKALLHPHPRNLHHRRVEAIRFFERNAPERFALFGHGWDIPPVAPGVAGRLVKRLNEWKRRWRPGPPPFPSYRGKIGRKPEILDRARFSICYENSRGSPGYLSEKIFDCFTSGCVPVYIGTTHAEPPIPADCYIDGDAFATPHDMLAFLNPSTRIASPATRPRSELSRSPRRSASRSPLVRDARATILADLPPRPAT